MTTATAWSTHPDARHAFNEAWSDLVNRLEGEPTLLLVYFTEQYSPDTLVEAIAQLPPHIKVHGSTSCKGVMTEEGFHSKDGRGLGLFGISDAGGDYGVGAANQKGDARKAGAEALINALADAGRPGEVPDLIWLSTPPGHEEEILKGIVDIVGAYVPVIGGTAADNTVAGRWRIVTRNSAQQDAVLVSVLFPAFKVSYSFQSGYFPTATTGVITSASGRVIHTIDHQPAGEVYKKWTAGLLDNLSPQGGYILSRITLAPVGRIVGYVGDTAYYSLSHPHSISEDGSLRLLTEVKVGEQLHLMSGSVESLISRAGRVTESAIALNDLDHDQLHGALMVYCAGCMQTVEREMDKVVSTMRGALRGKPFMGIFTFGEQGSVLNGYISHGNLMISSLVFSD
jgi:hypothetical protein